VAGGSWAAGDDVAGGSWAAGDDVAGGSWAAGDDVAGVGVKGDKTGGYSGSVTLTWVF
jgi:hypothetical protein